MNSVPVWKTSEYLRVKLSNSCSMNSCSSGFTSMSFMLNWIVNFFSVGSCCDMGSRKSSFVIMPVSFPFSMMGRQLILWLCIVFSACLSVVSGVTLMSGVVIMPFAGTFSIGFFSPMMSPVVCFRRGW